MSQNFPKEYLQRKINSCALCQLQNSSTHLLSTNLWTVITAPPTSNAFWLLFSSRHLAYLDSFTKTELADLESLKTRLTNSLSKQTGSTKILFVDGTSYKEHLNWEITPLWVPKSYQSSVSSLLVS